MPKNVIQITSFMENERRQYHLYSQNWGDARKAPVNADKWHRIRESAKAKGLSRDARKRLDWLLWYETTGQHNARRTCRHFGIAPKVFYFWRKRFSESNLATLEDRSHRPHRARQATLTAEQIERIVALRQQYLRYSKMKLAIIYRERFGEPISSWKIQQVIQRRSLYPNAKSAAHTAAKRRLAWKKKRITELVTKPTPGFLFCIDTVVRHMEGRKRYILTAIDRHSRLAFARMYSTHSSATAADFLRKLHTLLNGNLVHIQTDNGGEFHLHFEQAIQELKLTHWWSRVKTPKDNAVCERFNRTLQEEFIGAGNATPDVDVFNRKLTEWLVEYDFHRPHTALGYQRPIDIIAAHAEVLPINPSHTNVCHTIFMSVAFFPIPWQTMNRSSREFVNVDELIRRVSVEDVMQFYGVPSDSIQRLGGEIRTRCFLNCSKTEPTGDRALAIKVDDPAKRWCCHRYECEHKQGGNLVGLVDLMKPGANMNGRPRGERFKAILSDFQQIAHGSPPLPASTVVDPRPPQSASGPAKVNVPLAESENERARVVVNLHEKLAVDSARMNPAAASYFRRRPYLSAELCAKWKVGYLPHDTGGDKSGGTMRGKIVYPIHDEQGRVLTWFGRDPQYEEKLAGWKASDRTQREPEKVHFVKGYHRGLELFGQHRLAEPVVREAIQELRHLLIVEGPNNTLRLDALNIPSLAVCSNRITREQVERIAEWCRELGATAAVMFDCDVEGEAGGHQAVAELAQRCPVRLVWSRSMFSGSFNDRQPESMTPEEWEQLRGILVT